MKLEDCTKEELIRVCRMLGRRRQSELKQALISIEGERADRLLDSSIQLDKAAMAEYQHARQVLKPYAGRALGDIPISVIEQAAAHESQARALEDQAKRAYNRYLRISKLEERK